MDTLQKRVDVRSVNPMQGHVPKEVQHATVVSVPPPVMPTVVVELQFLMMGCKKI